MQRWGILTLGFFSFDRDLRLQTLPSEDYLRILYQGHSTIRGVDPAVDPTCRHYTDSVRALGVDVFSFLPLKRRFR